MTNGIGIDEHDHEGRVITLEMDDFYLVCCYTPNSQDGLKRLDYRMQWETDFQNYLKGLDAKKPVILCGDLNVAHEEIDIKNPKTNRHNAGFTDEERQQFTNLLDSGFEILMVVVSFSGPSEECRLAYRLLRDFRPSA